VEVEGAGSGLVQIENHGVCFLLDRSRNRWYNVVERSPRQQGTTQQMGAVIQLDMRKEVHTGEIVGNGCEWNHQLGDLNCEEGVR
jgi:hypothetical protein